MKKNMLDLLKLMNGQLLEIDIRFFLYLVKVDLVKYIK